MVFEELFPNRETAVKKWMPMTEWEGVSSDPSGRAQGSHIDNNVDGTTEEESNHKVPDYGLPGL